MASIDPELELRTTLNDDEIPQLVLRPEAHHDMEELDAKIIYSLVQEGDVILSEGFGAEKSLLHPRRLVSLADPDGTSWKHYVAHHLSNKAIPVHFNGIEDNYLVANEVFTIVAYASAVFMYCELAKHSQAPKAGPKVFRLLHNLTNAYHGPREKAFAEAFKANREAYPGRTLFGVTGALHMRKDSLFLKKIDEYGFTGVLIDGKLTSGKVKGLEKASTILADHYIRFCRIERKTSPSLAMHAIYEDLLKKYARK